MLRAISNSIRPGASAKAANSSHIGARRGANDDEYDDEIDDEDDEWDSEDDDSESVRDQRSGTALIDGETIKGGGVRGIAHSLSTKVVGALRSPFGGSSPPRKPSSSRPASAREGEPHAVAVEDEDERGSPAEPRAAASPSAAGSAQVVVEMEPLHRSGSPDGEGGSNGSLVHAVV